MTDHILLLLDELFENRQTMAVAESCTGGYIAHLLTNVAGSSQAFLGGFVTYSNRQKIKQLGVSAQSLELHGAVSEQVACEMADGTKKTYDAKGIGVLKKGMTSFAFTLPGDSKLDNIELEYDSAGIRFISKKAKVQILGKKREEK